MPERRWANRNWNTADEKGVLWSEVRGGAKLAVLMDIRDELQRLNQLLWCANFTGIPATLRKIAKNTTKEKAK